MQQDVTVRIDKFLASHGIAARRNIDEILQQNTVTVNGKKITESGYRFDEKKDTILFNGKRINQPKNIYIKLYKPLDVISTASDEFGRKTVISLVHSNQRIYPVGRLDQNTTGLLLLTNDGELANRLTHPRYHIPKTYLLTIQGNVSEGNLEKFRKGVQLEDGMTAPATATRLQTVENKSIIEVILHQGKKRQIRRMCERLHMPLIALKRIALGPITLGDLKEGEFTDLTAQEVADLKSEAYTD